MNSVAVRICHHLKLNVTRIFQEFFHVNSRIAESIPCLSFSHGDGIDKCWFCMHGSHTSTPTTAGCFDDNRIANFVSHFEIFLIIIRQGVVISRDAWDSCSQHGVFGRNFITHHAYGFSIRADKNKAALFYLFRKVSIFGKETVTRMNGFCISHFSCTDNGWNI